MWDKIVPLAKLFGSYQKDHDFDSLTLPIVNNRCLSSSFYFLYMCYNQINKEMGDVEENNNLNNN